MLEWNSPLPGHVASQQLIALWCMFDGSLKNMTAPQGTSDRKKEEKQHKQVVDLCFSIIPRLYQVLSYALDNENKLEVEIWIRALRSRPIIWIASAGNFVGK